MGWLDWILKPFRGASPEAEPEAAVAPAAPAPSPEKVAARAAKAAAKAERAAARAREEAAREAKEAARAAAKAAAKAAAQKAKPVETVAAQEKSKAIARAEARKAAPKGPKPPKGSKKARKGGTGPLPAPTGPIRDPRAEVVSIEEAERRYQAMLENAPTPHAAPVRIAEPVQAAVAPEVDAAEEARRAEAAAARRAETTANRQRARLPQFQALLRRTDALLAVPQVELAHLRAARDELVEGWKFLGAPPPEEAEALNAGREARMAALNARAQVALAALDAEHAQNLAQKRAIVEEARALAEREDLRGTGPAMGELRTQLRSTGPVAQADNEAVIADFIAAEERLKARHAQARGERDTARSEQLERLHALVRQAESLATSRDPEAAAQKVKELQAAWKEVRVPGPRTEPDAAWAKFRAACDAVFTRRTEARIEEGRISLERAQAIVLRAEGLAEAGGDGDAEDIIHKLVADWKWAGHVPREHRDALWARLQAAFDRLRSPPVDLPDQDEASLQFSPFRGLSRSED